LFFLTFYSLCCNSNTNSTCRLTGDPIEGNVPQNGLVAPHKQRVSRKLVQLKQITATGGKPPSFTPDSVPESVSVPKLVRMTNWNNNGNDKLTGLNLENWK
jgi:hypothetical protein